MKRVQLQKLVQQELENWDEPLSVSRMDDLETRAASPRANFSPTDSIGKKQPWFNQQ